MKRCREQFVEQFDKEEAIELKETLYRILQLLDMADRKSVV